MCDPSLVQNDLNYYYRGSIYVLEKVRKGPWSLDFRCSVCGKLVGITAVGELSKIGSTEKGK
jgi:hypothetical protein